MSENKKQLDTFIDDELDLNVEVCSYYKTFFGPNDLEAYKIHFLAETFDLPEDDIKEILKNSCDDED